ncbi:probable mitochondrial import inner membrane translocase subunit TIM21 [Primulina huaijiensis]|uniref:probable mitochondrial import inner membrane translocase subunit TIM21 n=1 Tax=Primulina huaijiensis TaxID=1492673 RepID=UPI003CC78BD4
MKSIRALKTILTRLQVAQELGIKRRHVIRAENVCKLNTDMKAGVSVLVRALGNGKFANVRSSLGVFEVNGLNITIPGYARSMATGTSESTRKSSHETKKDVTTVEDPFDAPTYNIPEKPMTFTEGASYSVLILAGLGIAAAAGYAVFKELLFEPKEYKIFGKALDRIKTDSQVRVRIGSPITGYGQESRNRAARQRIPNRVWTDEDGNEHIEVNFHIRGPHGAGLVGAEMFKDKVDKQWKFVYLIVEIRSPSPAKLLLESYVPA